MHSPESCQDRLELLRASFDARAAGWWRLVDHTRQLEQVAFTASADMPVNVAEAFRDATRFVSLDSTELGIVNAASTGRFAESRAGTALEGSGSAYFLRRFEAERSVAVPVCGPTGVVIGVVAVALSERVPGGEVVARAILDAVSAWPEFREAGLGGSCSRQ